MLQPCKVTRLPLFRVLEYGTIDCGPFLKSSIHFQKIVLL